VPKFYITTSIVYTNAAPHIGYAMELIQADALARYHRQKGDDVWFLTGTDEHGTKIKRAAEAAGQAPQAYVDGMAQVYTDLTKTLNLSHNQFIRTTDPAHEKACQALWKACEKDIYKSEYEGWYCVGCELFYTLTDVPDKVCPIHKKPLELIKESNYFFKLSAYTDRIKEAIKSGAYEVVPATRKNEILALLDRGLEDISISRDKSKLDWGVPVPGDDSQVMYVWFDALPNYISALGYPDGPAFKKYWPADTHLIGKDILRFHAAIWPAMLMSAGLPLPKQLLVHGFISSEGHKMSKSLGNLVQRVQVMFGKYLDHIIGDLPQHSHDVRPYAEAMEGRHFDKALAEIWLLVRGLNQFLEEEKPWEIAKTDTTHLGEVLHHAVSDLIQIATMLMPFMPETAAKIAATFAGGVARPEVGLLFPKHDQPPAGPAGAPASAPSK
jgi:methionyl-tRNA synthetase